jgi:hypothetical protein
MREIGLSQVGETSQSLGPPESMQTDQAQRDVVRLVLQRERELAGIGRLLRTDALAAVKTLAADGVVIRCGELLWASSGEAGDVPKLR